MNEATTIFIAVIGLAQTGALGAIWFKLGRLEKLNEDVQRIKDRCPLCVIEEKRHG